MEKSLPQRVEHFIKSRTLFNRQNRLLVALSGGMDSTTLFHVLTDLGYDCAVAHVNYRLRGEASNGDMRFVEELARSRDAKFFGKIAPIEPALDGESNIQLSARKIRYEYFERILDEYNYDYVVTAHHLDDSLETFLINLTRGTGIKGLTGIPERRSRIRRPLLHESRESILQYTADNRIDYREDASNQTDHYLRNRFRHQVIPKLKACGLGMHGFKTTLTSTAGIAELAAEAIATRVTRKPQNDGHLIIVDLKGLSPDAMRTLVHSASHPLGFTKEHLRQALETGSPTIEPEGKYVMRRVDGKMHISALPKEGPTVTPQIITSLPVTFVSASKRFSLRRCPHPGVLSQPDKQYLNIRFDPGNPGPSLSLRPRKDGDRMVPLGMGGKSKKLQDVFVDAKVPVHQRDQYLVLESGQTIIAIPSMRISEAAKVLPDDSEVLELARVDQ